MPGRKASQGRREPTPMAPCPARPETATPPLILILLLPLLSPLHLSTNEHRAPAWLPPWTALHKPPGLALARKSRGPGLVVGAADELPRVRDLARPELPVQVRAPARALPPRLPDPVQVRQPQLQHPERGRGAEVEVCCYWDLFCFVLSFGS